ncbi:MAG: pilus assembly protein [Bacilli bacterium]|nr:pilus assembly protein [Bacilli bacterium]
MLNNKGQSLVLFILIIPILLGIMALVIDVGNAFSKKNEVDNVIEFVLDYELSTKDVSTNNSENEPLNNENSEESLANDLIPNEETLKVLLNYNLKDNTNTVIIEEDIIKISSQTYVEGIFSKILNIKGFEIISEYQGYIENNKKIIQKVK